MSNKYPALRSHGIMFHHFHSDIHKHRQGSISSSDFERLLDYVSRTCNILFAKKWLKKALKGELAPKDICLTFDDTLKCQYDIAFPVMKERGLTGFFFINSSVLTGHVEKMEIYSYVRSNCFKSIDSFYDEFDKVLQQSKYISKVKQQFDDDRLREIYDIYAPYSWNDKRFRFVRDYILSLQEYEDLMDEITSRNISNLNNLSKQLWMREKDVLELQKENNVIGLHSYSHPTNMAALNYDMQRKDYTANLKHLEKLLNEDIISVSYPCNSYNEDSLNILTKLNIQIGFRDNMLPGYGDLMEFPREDHSNIMRMIRAVEVK